MLKKYIIATFVIAALCGVWRFAQFGDTELEGDQAFFTQWIIRLVDADHIFPVDTNAQGWFQALVRDEESFLNIILRQIYQAQMNLFVIVSVGLFTLAALAIGASMQTIVAISVGVSAIALWLISLFPVLTGGVRGVPSATIDRYMVGALTLFAGCFCSFLNVFSAFGLHNAGVMFLLLAAIVTQRWLSRASVSDTPFSGCQITIWMFVVQFMAIYSHYTNVFIIAPATVAAIALDTSIDLRRRAKIITRYSLMAIIVFLPAISLIAIYAVDPERSLNDQTFAAQAQSFIINRGAPTGVSIGDRAVLWFHSLVEIFSLSGLVLGILGVVGMAWRERMILPAAIVAVHFFFGTLLAPFAQYDRTAAYVLPMLLLGGGWFLILLIRQLIALRYATWRRRIAVSGIGAIALLATTAHGANEFERIENPRLIWRWGALTHEVVWRPIISQIDATLPEGSVLIPWDYGMSHQIWSMSERARRDMHIMRPLDTLMSHWRAGTLRQYIVRRGLAFPLESPIYVLVPGGTELETLATDLRHIFGRDGFSHSTVPRPVPSLKWKLAHRRLSMTNLQLFEIDLRNR